MKKQSLKNHSSDFYQKQELCQHKLDQLLDLTETIDTSSAKKSKNYWRTVAACFLIAALIPFGVQQFFANTPYPELVPQEIALNHSKGLSLEFDSQTYTSLSNMMSKLGFRLVNSSSPHLKGLTILGGRYCSIQGNIAAQIRLQDKNGVRYTLYQTPVTTALKSQQTGTLRSGDIKITQWQEKNLFFGLATSTGKTDS